jgi:hypothetical protein
MVVCFCLFFSFLFAPLFFAFYFSLFLFCALFCFYFVANGTVKFAVRVQERVDRCIVPVTTGFLFSGIKSHIFWKRLIVLFSKRLLAIFF